MELKEIEVDKAIERKLPEWVAMVVTTNEEGKPNVAPVAWCMFTSADPNMLAVSLHHESKTHSNLLNSGEFVVTFPSENQKKDVLYCGTHSGSNVNKFEKTDLTLITSSELDTPLIEDSVACYECKKTDFTKTGDHTIFVGEIVAAHISEKHRKKLYNFGKRNLRTIG